MRVDFPAFGKPMILTKPDLNGAMSGIGFWCKGTWNGILNFKFLILNFELRGMGFGSRFKNIDVW